MARGAAKSAVAREKGRPIPAGRASSRAEKSGAAQGAGRVNRVSSSAKRMGRVVGGAGGVGVQHFESADTNRLNEARWAFAGDIDVNTMLQGSLSKMRGRCRYEERNNPWVEGVHETYANHVIGHDGPMLQVSCEENEEFAQDLEDAWADTIENCDVSEIQELTDIAHMLLRNMWSDGEFLIQKYLTPEGVRLNVIDPNRLTSFGATPQGANHVIMGIERTPLGRPVAYHISKLQSVSFGQVSNGVPERIDARFILHGFQRSKPNQARGIPWGQTGLDDTANMREYDRFVLETAKSAARPGGIFTNENPEEAVDFDAPTVIDSEPGEYWTAPAGHKFSQVKAEQPTAQYGEFTNERRRGLGRAKSMPLMIINLDAGDHNMAGARFDGKIYETSVKRDQRWIKRELYTPILNDVALWLVTWKLFEKYQGKVPKFRATWTFQAVPATDPAKDAVAASERIRNGTSSERREASALGWDIDEVRREREEDIAYRKEKGLPLGLYGEGASVGDPAATADEGTAPSAPAKKKAGANGRAKAKAA